MTARTLSFVFTICAAASALACAAQKLPAVVEIGAARAGGEHPEDEPGGPASGELGAGCTWKDAVLQARGEQLPLCFAADGACFAHTYSVLSGEISVTLPAGEPAKTGAHLGLVLDGVRLQAWSPGDGILLAPRGPLAFGGVAIPRDGETLRVEKVGQKSVDLALGPVTGLHLKQGTLRRRVLCTDVGLQREGPTDEAIEQAVGRPARGGLGERLLTVGHVLALAESEKGPDVLEISVDADPEPTVELLEQRGARSLVLWWQPHIVYSGWTDSSSLSPPSGNGPDLYGVGTMSAVPNGSPGTRCSSDIPLHAEVAGAKERVGFIVKGTRFDVREREGDFSRVDLRSDSVSLESNAKWLVATSAIQGCPVE